MKAVIIEDETLVAKELEAKIAAVAPDVSIVTILPSLKTSRRWLMENAEPDMLFMDIQLGDGASFKLFEEFRLNCPVVFTTAYNEYAIKAFKVNGVDYLLKPVSEEELKHAIDKCRGIVAQQRRAPIDIPYLLESLTGSLQQKPLYKEKFIVSFRQQWLPINTSRIACFSKENLYYLHTFEGEQHIVDFNSMEAIEELLNPAQFYRANRQYIVNADAIRSIHLHENQKLTLKLSPPLKIEIDVSREKAPGFKKWFDR